MNRRGFLAGLGAALATVAIVTKLGQSDITLPKELAASMEGDFDVANLRFKPGHYLLFDNLPHKISWSSGLNPSEWL